MPTINTGCTPTHPPAMLQTHAHDTQTQIQPTDAAAPPPAALRSMRNGSLPSLPASGASVASAVQQAGGEILRSLDWAPCGTETPEKLKASFRTQLNSLSTGIDSARGHAFKLEDAYARFAGQAQALLAFCTPSRIEEAEVERIARAVLRHLEAAPQQPPYRPTPGLDTLEAAKQAAAYYAAR